MDFGPASAGRSEIQPWEAVTANYLVGRVGLEPTTIGLEVRRAAGSEAIQPKVVILELETGLVAEFAEDGLGIDASAMGHGMRDREPPYISLVKLAD